MDIVLSDDQRIEAIASMSYSAAKNHIITNCLEDDSAAMMAFYSTMRTADDSADWFL